jgi:hypothetical protein
MTRTFGHTTTLRYLRHERAEEVKAAWFALGLSILFLGGAVASIIMVGHNSQYLFPFFLSGSIAAGCGFRVASCVAVARNLTAQIRNLEEDFRL